MAQLGDNVRILPTGEGLNFAWCALPAATEKAIYRSMQDIIKQAFMVAETRVKERQLQQQQQRQHLSRDRSHGGMGGGHTNDGAESKLRNMNVALPLDSQRQAMSRQRMETQREQRQNRSDRNGKDGKDLQAQMTPFENPLYKTRLCERFETEAYCPYGPKCTFAHGTTELRERPQEAAEKAQGNGLAANKDGPENPLYKTRLCERFMKENFCQYGPKCNFGRLLFPTYVLLTYSLHKPSMN